MRGTAIIKQSEKYRTLSCKISQYYFNIHDGCQKKLAHQTITHEKDDSLFNDVINNFNLLRSLTAEIQNEDNLKLHTYMCTRAKEEILATFKDRNIDK